MNKTKLHSKSIFSRWTVNFPLDWYVRPCAIMLTYERDSAHVTRLITVQCALPCVARTFHTCAVREGFWLASPHHCGLLAFLVFFRLHSCTHGCKCLHLYFLFLNINIGEEHWGFYLYFSQVLFSRNFLEILLLQNFVSPYFILALLPVWFTCDYIKDSWKLSLSIFSFILVSVFIL